MTAPIGSFEAIRDAYMSKRRSGKLCRFDQGQENAMLQVCAVVHPDGADAWDRFWEWYEHNPGWFGPHRAFASWLSRELKLDRTITSSPHHGSGLK